MSAKLEQLLASGELNRLARECGTQRELAERVGMTGNQYKDRARRLREAGKAFPTFVELRRADLVEPSEWAEDAPTNPCAPNLAAGPALAAFDSEHEDPQPTGHYLKGVSTYYDQDGVIRGQWVKTNLDRDRKHEALLEAMTKIAEAWQGKADPVQQPAVYDEDLLCVLPIGDPHVGMFSWNPETGSDFDLKIAERDLIAAVDHLVGLAPPCARALIVNLGDFFHSDSKGSATTKGTRVDVDGRWPKVLAVGIRIMRRMIDRALEKADHVTVINEIGNHDDHSSIMLALCLSQFYEREPRVTVDTSPAKFHWYRFGQNLIGTTHGDTVKLAALPQIMACDRKRDWGETSHRRFYVGHVHHDQALKEHAGGVIVETFRTLAPADAWHAGQGYRSGRDMKLDVFHREWGHINRHIVGIAQIACKP